MNTLPQETLGAFRDHGNPAPEDYETMLLDAAQGDATLFMRADQVETAWAVLMPILSPWETSQPPDFPNYAAAAWGETRLRF